MSKTVNDIALIKKYLAGELDARAMHDLERRALDDPFLADAIEGYDNAGGDQQKNLADLSGRLQARTDKKVRALTPMMQLSIAASLLVIVGIGAWLVIRSRDAKQDELKQIAVNVPSTAKPQQPTVSAPSQFSPQTADTIAKANAIASNRFTPPASVSSQSDADVSQQPPALAEIQIKKDTTTAHALAANSAVPGNGYPGTTADKQAPVQYKSNPAANDAIVQSLGVSKSAAKKYKSMMPETLLSAHNDNLQVKPALRSGTNYNTLVGYVSGNNQPLAGAIVKMAGTNFGVVTDENGRFVLHDVPDNKSLTVKSLGYASKQVKVNGGDSINVSLEANSSALAEVAITAPVANNNSDKSSGSTGAHPGAGWKALNDYLDKNAISPDGKTGKVVLLFTLDGRGSLSNFKVTQSLGNTDDQKAIDLIQNGPAWAGNIDGKAHEVKVTVSFH